MVSQSGERRPGSSLRSESLLQHRFKVHSCLQALRPRLYPRLQAVSQVLSERPCSCLRAAEGDLAWRCRSKSDQYTNTSLIKIHGVESKKEVDFYLGKRIAYIYKAKTVRKGTRFRVIWGKVCRPDAPLCWAGSRAWAFPQPAASSSGLLSFCFLAGCQAAWKHWRDSCKIPQKLASPIFGESLRAVPDMHFIAASAWMQACTYWSVSFLDRSQRIELSEQCCRALLQSPTA